MWEPLVRAACLQNETAPKNFNFKTKNGPKNDPELPRKMLSLVLLCRISHRHSSKIFHREFPHKIKYFFTTKICRHGHANACVPECVLKTLGCRGLLVGPSKIKNNLGDLGSRIGNSQPPMTIDSAS